MAGEKLPTPSNRKTCFRSLKLPCLTPKPSDPAPSAPPATNPSETPTPAPMSPPNPPKPKQNTSKTPEETPEHALVKVQPIKKDLPADAKLTLAMFANAVSSIGKELISLAHEWDAGKYERQYKYQNYSEGPTHHPPRLPKHVISLPRAEAFPSEQIGHTAARIHNFIRAQLPLIARIASPDKKTAFADLGHDVFRAFFDSPDLFSMPGPILSKHENHWLKDEIFADQFLNGCNPTVIERPKDMDHVRSVMPKELLSETEMAHGRSVQQLLDDNDLFFADYAILQTPGLWKGYDEETGAYYNEIHFEAVGNTPHMTKYFYAPFVAFYKNRETGMLGVLGIVLTRHEDKPNEIYNPRTCSSKPNIYAFAKMHVACADNQLHQFYYHLGRCHLTYEPFGVAVRNIFQFGSEAAQDHMVGRLLQPHFSNHMAVNWLARNTLVASGEGAIPFTDASFALGAKGGLSIFALKYVEWKLLEHTFPAQLKNRGFDPEGDDGLSRYFYRDDGMRVWTALEKYVETALKDFYSSKLTDEAAASKERDAKIQADKILPLWCREMRDVDKAYVPSFPAKFTSLSQLRDTITTIIYNVSAEHAAVNFSQERYLSYCPNRPNSLFKTVPTPSAKSDLHLIRDILAIHRSRGDDEGASMPLSFAVFQVQFSNLLTIPPVNTLVHLDALKYECPKAYDGLMKDLERIHYVIKARNIEMEEKTPHLPPYEFLDPVQIPKSIEI